MIAITGANGLLGSIIVRKFLHENLHVIGIKRKNSDLSLLDDVKHMIEWRDADIIDPLALNDALQNVNTVIHAAAIVSFNPREAKRIFKVNVEGTANIVNACLLHGVSKLIHISSVAALGIQKGALTIDEDTTWVNNPLHTDYAESKYLAELEVARGFEEGLHAGIFNPSLVLAPGNWDLSSAKLFKYVWQEKPFYMDRLINYVDARDVAEMIFKFYQSGKSGERYIANAGSISLKEFFDDVAKRLNKKAPSIHINHSLASIAAVLESIRSFLTGSEPFITKQMLGAGMEQHVFENKKSIAELGIQYHSLENTLNWCCEFYLQHNTINKQ